MSNPFSKVTAMLGGGVGDEEAADVVFEGVDPDASAFGQERGFVEAGVGEDLAKGTKAEAALEQGEVVEGAFFDEFVALAETAEIEDAGLDQNGRFEKRCPFLRLANEFNGPVDDVFGVEFVADFDDRGAGEESVGTDAETLIGEGPIVPIKNKEAFARDRLMNHFGDAFADPIEVLILR